MELNSVELDLKEISIKDEFPAKNKGGSIKFYKREIVSKPNFVDYLRSGVNIGFTCAIDYTLSNGTQTSPQSLHYIDPNKMNEYQRSLLSVG